MEITAAILLAIAEFGLAILEGILSATLYLVGRHREE